MTQIFFKNYYKQHKQLRIQQSYTFFTLTEQAEMCYQPLDEISWYHFHDENIYEY